MASRSKKFLLAAACILGLVVLSLVLVLFVEFDSPELGRLALSQIGKSSGFDLQAQGFRLNLMRGLELQQVEATGPMAGGEMSVQMERLVLKHRPADLLGGTLTVTEIVLDQPRIELVSETEASGPESPAAEIQNADQDLGAEEPTNTEGTSLDLAISTLRLQDGALVQRVIHGGTIETTEVRGLEVELNDLTVGSGTVAGSAGGAHGAIRIDEITLGASSGEGAAAVAESTTVRDLAIEIEELALDGDDPTNLAGASLKGGLSVAEVISGVDQAQDVAGRLELAQGRFGLRELVLTAPQGKLRGEVEADVAADPVTYSVRLDGDALSTGVLLGLGDLSALGTSAFELAASGDSSDIARLVGEGQLKLNGGKLPDHPIFAQIEQILGNAALVGVGYDAFPVTFDIHSKRVHLARCELRAGPISLAMNGWVDFDGPIEMELSVLTPREGLSIKEIPLEVLDALSEEDGRVNLPMLVSGTAEQSAVALNRQILQQLAKQYVRKTVEKEVGKALLGLFGKKDDEDG